VRLAKKAIPRITAFEVPPEELVERHSRDVPGSAASCLVTSRCRPELRNPSSDFPTWYAEVVLRGVLRRVRLSAAPG
jgi:hypothetical protein